MSTLVVNRLKTKLAKYNAKLISNVDNIIVIECKDKHVFEIKYTSLGNKLRLLEKGGDNNICATCHLNETSTEQQSVKTACEKLNFEFIHFDKNTRKATYKCCCGVTQETSSSNLLKKDRKSQCPKCQNDGNKHSIEHVKLVFESVGCELLEEHYINKHTPMSYKCNCGVVAKISYGDLIRGKQCKSCKNDRMRKTCLEKYGVDNPSKHPEIFKKISENMLKKKDFTWGDKKWRVMGYEPWCLGELLNSGVNVDNLYAGEDLEIPSVTYSFEDKSCVWYPDIYIKGKKLIEVKSTWTYNMAPEKMRAKMECSPMDCELWIYEEDGSIFEIVYKNVSEEFKYKNGKMVIGERLNV